MISFNDQIDQQKSFIVELFDGKVLSKFNLYIRPFISLSFFIPFLLLFIILRFKEFNFSSGLIIGILGSSFWLYIGQIFIYKHHHEVYKRFWEKLLKLDDDKKEVVLVNREINIKYKKFEKFLFVLWIILILVALRVGKDGLEIIKIYGVDDPFFFMIISISIVAGYLTAIGLSQSLKMVYSIKKVSERINIPFDELNEDGLGNYSVISKYCFPTTLYLTSGVLFIPILVEFMNATSENAFWLTFSLILIFSAFILVSLVYPLTRGHFMARESKRVLLLEVRTKLMNSIKVCINEPIEKNKIHWETLKYKYELIKVIPTYPFELNVIMKIIGTTLIPVITFFVQIFITDDIVLDIIRSIF